MSRVPKYYIEKAKVKVVFRLQFQATHIPQTGWDKLFLSFIPIDTGKASAKTNKANVRNGTCKWPDPIYEATRLLQDPGTRAYDEKVYKLVVAMGSSRSSILGEGELNLADFAEAQKPSSVSLPLQGCDCGVVLHVTVQLLTTKTGFREFSQQKGDTNVKSPQSNPRNHHSESEANLMVRAKVSSVERMSVEEVSESNEDHDDSALAIDGSSCTSDSIFVEKTENSGIHEIDGFRSSFSGSIGQLSSNTSVRAETEEIGGSRIPTQRSNDWTHGWSPGYSAENNFAVACEENNRLRLRLEVAESAFLQLKSEAKSLQRITDELSSETKGLAQHLAAELDSGQQLTREVSVLRTECLNLKRDLENLRLARILQAADSEISCSTNGKLVQKNVGMASKLEDKICDLLQKLEESKTEKENLVLKMNHMEHYYEAYIHKLEENQKQMLAEVDHLRNEHSSCYYTNSVLRGQKQKAQDELNQQIAKFAEERSALESLNQKLESRAIASESALKRVRSNYSKAVDRLQKDLELLSFQVLSMYESNENIAKQTFSDAIQNIPEECLREANTCGNRADFPGVFENQNVSGTRETRQESAGSLPDYYVNGKAYNIRVKDEMPVCRSGDINSELTSPNCNSTKTENNNSGREVKISEDDETTIKSLEDLRKTCSAMELELLELCASNFEWTILSDSLVQLQHEARSVRKLMEEKFFLLEQELHDSVETRESLNEKLNCALNEANECETRYISNLDELVQKNKNLEVRLHDVSTENACLLGKVSEYERLAEERKTYEMKNKACEEERSRIELLLMQERMSKTQLESDIRSFQAECKTLKEKINECETRYISNYDDLVQKNKNLEVRLQDVSNENACLLEKVSEYDKLAEERKTYEMKNYACEEERSRIEMLLMQERMSKSQLESDIRSLEGKCKTLKEEFNKQSLLNTDLQDSMDSVKEKLQDLSSNIASYSKEINLSTFDDASPLQKFESKEHLATLWNLENFVQRLSLKILELSRDNKEMEDAKVFFQKASERAGQEKLDMKRNFDAEFEAMTSKLNLSTGCIEKLEQELKCMTENYVKLQGINGSLLSRLTLLEDQLEHVLDEKMVLTEKLQDFTMVLEELESTKVALAKCEEENQTLTTAARSRMEEFLQMETEFRSLRDELQVIHGSLVREKSMKEELEYLILDIRSQLDDRDLKLCSANDEIRKLLCLEQKFANLERANEAMHVEILASAERQEELKGENVLLKHQISNVENQLTCAICDMLAYETEAFYMYSVVRDHALETLLYNKELEKLHRKNLDTDALLRECMSKGVELVDKNARLEDDLCSLRSMLENTIQENEMLKKHEEETPSCSHDCELTSREVFVSNGNKMLCSDVEYVEESLYDLRADKEELEILSTILKYKLKEHQMEVSLLRQSEDELVNLRAEHLELTQKLADQILKTEEYKNLSVQFRELKDKAESDYQKVCGRKDKEGSLFAMQESLRIAFIKEQYESKVQELRHELSAAKKYSEEMLLKLQNAVDEVETSKKNEISLAKRIEELSVKISELESELQDLLADRRELAAANDSLKTELECTALSLDCCKEEKLKVEAHLGECNEECSRIKEELDAFKRLLENIVSPESSEAQGTRSTESVENSKSRSLASESFQDESEGNFDNSLADTYTKKHIEEQQKLVDEMNVFQKSLERLKSENLSSIVPMNIELIDPSLDGLERALSQLDSANVNLENIFPAFKELPSTGNALERVLALELELADALHVKRKSENRFQSSFLKQHNDDAAVFQSFRDINELIQDMLELKRRHATLEGELKDMQGRYSELSLQFAEVEGERQKLMMSLKNRSPRKA